MSSLPPHGARWLAAFWAFSLCACLYDHRVTQSIVERRNRAKAAEGAEIHAGPANTTAVRHVGRVRLYVAADYRQQHPEWRLRAADLVDQASSIVGPEFGVRLDVVGVHAWDPSCDRAQLSSCLDELSGVDPGEDGVWIVGMLGALPRFTTSFDELGMARVPGRHFVLRDVSDLAERAAIDRAFASFTESRRDEIYARRKRHKRLAVFLHEWAHTLGALHTTASDDLLNPSYDERMEAYGSANRELLAASLEDHFTNAGHDGLLAWLEAHPDAGFEARAREYLIAVLKRPPTLAAQEHPTESVEHPFVVRGPEEVVLSGVAESDLPAYRGSVSHTVAGEALAAWDMLAPLVTRYADCYAIQHLACGLLMQLGSSTDVQTVCPRAQRLATAIQK